MPWAQIQITQSICACNYTWGYDADQGHMVEVRRSCQKHAKELS